MKRLKAEDVICPRVELAPEGSEFDDTTCKSQDKHFSRPLWKSREYEDVIIPCTCNACGHIFNVLGHIVMTKVD